MLLSVLLYRYTYKYNDVACIKWLLDTEDVPTSIMHTPLGPPSLVHA